MPMFYIFLIFSFTSSQSSPPKPAQTEISSLPKSLDWRNYQGINYLTSFKPKALISKCNASWAILVASTLSDRLKILRSGKSPDIQLSSQYLLSCVGNSKPCSNGDIIKGFKFILNNSIPDELTQPNAGKDFNNDLTCDQLKQNMNCAKDEDCLDSKFNLMFGISSYQKVTGVEQMVKALQSGPIVCRILRDSGFLDYKEGIYDTSGGKDGDYDYLSVVGYGSEGGKEFWIGRSAYGERWGSKGYIKVAKGKNVLNVENYCAYGIPANNIKIISKDNQQVVNIEDITKISLGKYNTKYENCGQETNTTSHEKYIPFNEFQYPKILPKHRFVLVFGPSQVGKSTFINNLLEFVNSKLEKAKVGSGIGQSTTIKINFYNIGNILALFPEDIQNYDSLTLIDVPGIFDSEMRISKEEIFDQLKQKLFEYGVNSLDAILMFESVYDDSRKVYQTMQALQEYFGKEVKDSTIVLSTKWDKIDEDDKKGVENYLNSMIKTIQVSTMKWQNNFGTKKVLSKPEMYSQLLELGKNIKKLNPYRVEDMNTLLKKRDELAKEIRENDPNRYSFKDEVRIEYIPEEFVKEIDVQIMEIVNLTNEEIELKAKKLFDSQIPIPGGLIPDPSGKRNTTKRIVQVPETIQRTESYRTGHWPFRRTRHRIVQEVIWKDKEELIDHGPMMIRAEDIKIPIDYFRGLVSNETKLAPVTKKVFIKEIRNKKIERMIKKNQEIHDFEYYQKQASEQINKEFVEFIRSKLNN